MAELAYEEEVKRTRRIKLSEDDLFHLINEATEPKIDRARFCAWVHIPGDRDYSNTSLPLDECELWVEYISWERNSG